MTESIPVTISTTEEEMGFLWRLTMKGGGTLGVDVGDDFRLNPAFGDDDLSMIGQVGLSAVIAGMQLMGLPKDERDMVAMLLLTMTDGDDDDG